MQALSVSDLNGTSVVSTSAELMDALSRRVAGANHFLLAPVGAEHPQLDVLVRDDVAVLHYFRGDESSNAQSLSDRAVAEVLFPDNLTGELVQLPGSAAIDAAVAMQCVAQFAESLARPTLVDWFDL
jgi:hypothetical protein